MFTSELNSFNFKHVYEQVEHRKQEVCVQREGAVTPGLIIISHFTKHSDFLCPAVIFTHDITPKCLLIKIYYLYQLIYTDSAPNSEHLHTNTHEVHQHTTHRHDMFCSCAKHNT